MVSRLPPTGDEKLKKLRIILPILLTLLFSITLTMPVYADDPPDENSDTVVGIGIDGNLKVDIDASGPSELNVDAQGPAKVSIDAGDEVKLNVAASDESQILIEGQGIDEPTGQQETEYENPATDLNSSSLQLNDPVVSSGNHMTIMLAASAIAAGLAAFFLIGRFIYRKGSERKIK